ncbi:hypothetical protein L6452_41908 [Arctium lappa]|uniref:Uncharacterized protein n=1 Tax=Arctium lappa TaxID=4217 RepID=A0ACB8XHH5_ARCLA|nr:hypothetical protein L6452_41908 [Arctium lappa]
MQGTTKEDEDEITTTLETEGKHGKLIGRESKSALPMSHYCINSECWSAYYTRGCLDNCCHHYQCHHLEENEAYPCTQTRDISVTTTLVGAGATQINPQSDSDPSRISDPMVEILPELKSIVLD